MGKQAPYLDSVSSNVINRIENAVARTDLTCPRSPVWNPAENAVPDSLASVLNVTSLDGSSGYVFIEQDSGSSCDGSFQALSDIGHFTLEKSPSYSGSNEKGCVETELTESSGATPSNEREALKDSNESHSERNPYLQGSTLMSTDSSRREESASSQMVVRSENVDLEPENVFLIDLPPNMGNIDSVMDSFFFSHFANRFLPTIAQPHFHHAHPQHSLVLSAASRSDMLREIFVACGASLVAFDNLLYQAVARDRYKQALLHFLTKIKHGVVGSEDWFFVAVQVLQTLCLRDAFGGSNATRCAAHFGAAYKIIVNLLHRESGVGPQFSPLERVMIENFIFNYSITIFYCDHNQLARLVPNPFDFFAEANSKLTQMSYEDGSPQSSRLSMLAFQIAAKCSWLCRLRLPLDAADQRLHFELLLFADTILFSLESVDFSGENLKVQNTVSVAKVVLRASIILMRKMLDLEKVNALDLQGLVEAIVADIAKPCNKDIIFPIWAVMIAASTTLVDSHKLFFKERLQQLVDMSKSTIALQVVNHMDGLWEIYSGDEPFELLFDTTVLDQVCK